MRLLPASSDSEIAEIVGRLRLHEDVEELMEAVSTDSLLPSIEQSIEATPGLEASYSNEDQRFCLVKGTKGLGAAGEGFRHARSIQSPQPSNSSWTSVTDDDDFIEHLLTLYFTWQHAFFQSFPEKLFREDLIAGRTDHCSRMLVNSICAAGCLLSDWPQARRNAEDSLTAGLDFFDEAMRLLDGLTVPGITTVASLYLLCHVDGHRGRLSSVWSLCGRSARMALDLNLHQRPHQVVSPKSSSPKSNLQKGRQHVFWGCFIGDQ